MRYLLFSFLFILLLLLSSCAFPQPAEQKLVTVEEDEPAMIVPAPSREAVFVSENQMLADKPEIILKLNSDPRLLPVGYVRLAGIVNGVAPLALLDVVGRSVCLELNDELGGYRLVKIDGQAIYLRRL